jgi:hypothetical protein
MSEERKLNWYGWSIYTIAAVYESDAAAHEVEDGLVNMGYLTAACFAEQKELELDIASTQKEQEK